LVQRDALQLLGIRGWSRRAENGDEWRRFIREAKARKELQRHICTDGYRYFPYGPYSLYRASVPAQGCTLPFFKIFIKLYRKI